jgi:acid stress chaperone HdeB
MPKYGPVVIGLFLLPSISGARAQVTVDVSKITCEQFTLFKITNPRNIALWISGYVHGQRSDKIVDPQTFETNVQQLKDYCVSNPKDTVMDVVTRQTSGK